MGKEQELFSITVLELLLLFLLFVLSRVVADPWINACEKIYFSFTKHSPSSALHSTIYAMVITVIVVVIFIFIDFLALLPGGTKNFLYKL